MKVVPRSTLKKLIPMFTQIKREEEKDLGALLYSEFAINMPDALKGAHGGFARWNDCVFLRCADAPLREMFSTTCVARAKDAAKLAVTSLMEAMVRIGD